MAHYTKEVKEQCIQLRLSGRTIKSITTEYGLGSGTLQYWMDDYYKKAQPGTKERDSNNLELIKEVEELKKEIEFLKKAASYFASSPKR